MLFIYQVNSYSSWPPGIDLLVNYNFKKSRLMTDKFVNQSDISCALKRKSMKSTKGEQLKPSFVVFTTE